MMNTSDRQLNKFTDIEPGSIHLPSSKSVNNRVLIISHLAGNKTRLLNPSNARDSELLRTLLATSSYEVDARDAGTTYRFLTAYFCVTNQDRVLSGTPRMKERPIRELVEALRTLGGEIDYLEEEGFPPLHIKGFVDLKCTELQMRGDISSQYISAILMIAPLLQSSLKITFLGKLGSWPYIEMTASIMKRFGARIEANRNLITVQPGRYIPMQEIEIEPDWSAASYWYSLVSISQKKGIHLQGLTAEALQGDSIIASMMESLGVSTVFEKGGATLLPMSAMSSFQFDFTDCPDLAQTIAVICAAKGISCEMTGLESLKIKETDRCQALHNELSKFGAQFIEQGDRWIITGKIRPHSRPILINTYHDHRMAMAFAPLSYFGPLVIENPSVVNKSYPHFWKDFESTTI